MGRDILIALYIKYKGDWDKIYQDICKKVYFDFKTYLAGINLDDYITLLDPDYPEALKHTHKPPFVYERTPINKHWTDMN